MWLRKEAQRTHLRGRFAACNEVLERVEDAEPAVHFACEVGVDGSVSGCVGGMRGCIDVSCHSARHPHQTAS